LWSGLILEPAFVGVVGSLGPGCGVGLAAFAVSTLLFFIF
jgi:hypothetical protein